MLEWVLSIATAILAVITGYYAYCTGKLSKIAASSFRIEHRPYLGLDNLHIELIVDEKGERRIDLGIVLLNTAKTIAAYEMEYLNATFSGIELSKRYASNGGHVMPAFRTIFRFQSFKIISSPIEGTISYKIGYSSLYSKEKYYSEKIIEYRIYIVDDKKVQWSYTFSKDIEK